MGGNARSRLPARVPLWLLFIAQLLLLLPLFFHQSQAAVFLGYSRKYLLVLGFSVCCAIIVFFFTRWRCAKAGSGVPAWLLLMSLLGIVTAVALAETALRFTPFNDPFREYREWGHKRSILFGKEAAPKKRVEESRCGVSHRSSWLSAEHLTWKVGSS